MYINKTFNENFSKYIIEETSDYVRCDYRTIYQFPNEYGASVVCNKGSYGLEVAILYFPPDEDEWIISETVDSNEELGYVKDLNDVLKKIYDKPLY